MGSNLRRGSETINSSSAPVRTDPSPCSDSSDTVTFHWCNTINDIPGKEWDTCFDTSRFARTYNYQRAVESSSPAGVRFQYLVAWEAGSIRAIVGCFRYKIPLSTTATGAARKVMSFIERFLPGIFSINGFFVGQLTAVCDHLYGLEQISAHDRSEFLAQCEPSIRQRALELRSSVILHKEIPGEDLAFVSEALGDDYVIAPSLPAMELKLESTTPFSQQLRKKYRNHYRRRQKQADQRGLTWDVHRGSLSATLAGEMERLYFQVLDRSGTQFERLSSCYFSSLMEHCPGACIVLCRDGDHLVGFMVNVASEEAFHGLYLGYDVSYREAAVYFNLIYRSLDVALEQGHQFIHLGQTSYEIKSALGAKRSDLHLALRARNPVVHGMITCFSKHLFPEIDVPVRRAFARTVAGRSVSS